MTESGDHKDNTQAERINKTMKNELLKDSDSITLMISLKKWTSYREIRIKENKIFCLIPEKRVS